MITVIIPIYNVSKYLKNCLESVINQTYKNLEIICINDGSTDNSGKICDEFAKKDSRITVVHQENQGAGAAKNTGLELIEGEYFSIIDSDDYIDCDALRILEQTAKDSDSDIVFFEALSFAENQRDRSLKQSYVYKKDKYVSDLFNIYKNRNNYIKKGHEYIEEYMALNNYFGGYKR